MSRIDVTTGSSEDLRKPGERDERYPRTNAKKYHEAPIWKKMGPKKPIVCTIEEAKTVEICSNCFCGAVIRGKLEHFPITCPDCRTVHKARIVDDD